MLKTLGVLVIIAGLVGAWGWYRGWFTVERSGTPDSPRITFGLDKNRVKHDADVQRAKFDDAMQSLDHKIDDLKARAKTATADQKAALDRTVADLEVERDAIRAKIDRLTAETDEKLATLRQDIQRQLDAIGAKVDHALSSGSNPPAAVPAGSSGNPGNHR